MNTPPPTQTPKSSPPTVWQRFASVPHRAFSALGTLAVLVLALWWTFTLATYHHSASVYPPVTVHAVLMPLGLFPLFILGFLFTAGPRWLAATPPRHPLPLALSYFGGLMLALIGFHQGGAWPVPGLLLMLGAWLSGCLAWMRCLQRAEAEDTRHGWRLFYALLGGAAAMGTTLVWVATGDGRLWIAATVIALWGFLLPIFLTVSHRMLPFFTQSALPFVKSWRPYALLNGWLVACAAIVCLTLAGFAPAGGVVALALATSLAYTSVRWGLHKSFSNRLLAMLHLSFAWLAPTLVLQGLGMLGINVGAAPAHALGLGFCGTMMVGFVTRVTLGHSGRPLQADTGFWAIYLALHALALLRVALALAGASPKWLPFVSLLWLALMLVWAARVLPIYWRPRTDGKPG